MINFFTSVFRYISQLRFFDIFLLLKYGFLLQKLATLLKISLIGRPSHYKDGSFIMHKLTWFSLYIQFS